MRQFVLIVLLFAFTASFSQTLTGDAAMIRKTLNLRGKPVDSVQNDTSFVGQTKALPTPDAVARFVAGRMANLPAGGGGMADSSLFSTNFRRDTAIKNLRLAKLNIADTAAKWVSDLRLSNDSVYKRIGTIWYFIFKVSSTVPTLAQIVGAGTTLVNGGNTDTVIRTVGMGGVTTMLLRSHYSYADLRFTDASTGESAMLNSGGLYLNSGLRSLQLAPAGLYLHNLSGKLNGLFVNEDASQDVSIRFPDSSGKMATQEWVQKQGYNNGAGGTALNGVGYVKQSGPTTSYQATIPNSDLANSSISVAGVNVPLGGNVTRDAITGLNSGIGLLKRTTTNTYGLAVPGTDYNDPASTASQIRDSLNAQGFADTTSQAIANSPALITSGGAKAYTDAVAAGKANSSHTHPASDIASGQIATARMAIGTPLEGYVSRIRGGVAQWLPDSTAAGGSGLPTTGGAMTGGVDFSNAATTGITLYNTADQVTNYERFRVYWSSNQTMLVSDAGGSGVGRGITIASTSNISLSTGSLMLNNGYTSSVARNWTTINPVTTNITGTANFLAMTPTVNQGGSASYRVFWVSAYEQATGSAPKFLIDAGLNSAPNGGGAHTSKFSVANDGTTTMAGKIYASGIGAASTSQALYYNTTTKEVTYGAAATGSGGGTPDVVKVGANNTQITHTGTTAETTIYTLTIPAGSLGVNGSLDVLFYYTNTNNANNKTWRVKLNGTTIYTNIFASSTGMRGMLSIANRNSLTSQVMGNSTQIGQAAGFATVGSLSPTTTSIDFGADVTLTVTVELATSTDVANLEFIRTVAYK